MTIGNAVVHLCQVCDMFSSGFPPVQRSLPSQATWQRGPVVGSHEVTVSWDYCYREGGNRGICACAAFFCSPKPIFLAKPLTVCTPACDSVNVFLPGRCYLCGCCFSSCSLCTFRVTSSIFG